MKRNILPMSEPEKGGVDIIAVCHCVEMQVAKMLRGRC